MKKVFKYGTGQEIPEGAVYLSTQVETFTRKGVELVSQDGKGDFTTNVLVWHYFLVEIQEAGL